MHVVSMGHGYERQNRERKSGEGIMGKKWWVLDTWYTGWMDVRYGSQ